MSTKYLNTDNILKKVYDPSAESLRTTAVASFVGGTVDISISDLTDSIKIGDGSGVYLDINPDGSINANIEVDAGDGDNIGLKVQDRNLSPSDLQYSKRVTAKTGTINLDTTSLDIALHHHTGNEITDRDPLFISSNYEKIIEVILNSSWMTLAVYDEVVTTVSSDRTSITLLFKEDTITIGEAVINFVSDFTWDFVLYRYLVDDDGSQLLDDDDTPLFLD